METKTEVIVALDTSSPQEALSLAKRLMPDISVFKVGMELFYSCGPAIVGEVAALGAKVFLDLKLHDIPATVGRAMAALVRPGLYIIDVHASGGSAMMKEGLAAARKAAAERDVPQPKVVGVTVLTSIDPRAFAEEVAPGCDHGLEEHVVRMARLAKENGLDGVVTSALEAPAVREACGRGFITVVPGVRPAWAADAHDQRRCVTPGQAVLAGADFIVVGRPITHASCPRDAAKKLLDEVKEASLDGRG
ncbi:MAG: orotidine-5'-phosphate decarboxylase [Betaproteobacteria bacterium]